VQLCAHLVQATYDWITARKLTPYVLVNATYPGVAVPKNYVKQGRILLNLLPEAITNLHIDVEGIKFEAAFSGSPWQISIPLEAMQALYARETEHGLYLNSETGELYIQEGNVEALPQEKESALQTKARKAGFKIIK